MTERMTLTSDSTLTGLSGRTLKVPQTVADLNASKEFHLGIKHAYDFFPNNLITRLSRERSDAWYRTHRPIVADARLKLSSLREENASATAIVEAESRLSFLLSAEKNYHDPGPIFDCITFFDGKIWRAIVDISQRGMLEKCDVLENFAINGAFSQFLNGTMLNFAVNIYDNGNLLSIVVDCGNHGTHVAGILAANFPDSPHLNGLAPGARIVSLKIGDSRLSSMETHQGLIRALAYCLKRSPYQTRVQQDPSERELTKSSAYDSSTAEKFSTFSTSKKVETDKELVSDSSKEESTSAASLTPVQVSSKDPKLENTPGSTIIVDIINMSFGELSRDVDRGRFVELANELVRKHNVIFVSSAGNDGPGLSSVSAPGGTTSSIIGVGAYFTPDMVTQAYSYLDSEYGLEASQKAESSTILTDRSKLTKLVENESKENIFGNDDKDAVIGTAYTWSARGCCSNGSIGVSIAAPGAAWAPVPQWDLRKKKLMNGTSMSSPSAAGAIAVILSYLKMKGIPYTSALLRRAVENTARSLKPIHGLGRDDEATNHYSGGKSENASQDQYDLIFATGRGSIDALAACQYIENYMIPRKIPDHEESSAESTTAEDPPPSPGGVSKGFNGSLVQNESGSSQGRSQCYSGQLENFGDSSFHLEDWHYQVAVEDGNSGEGSKPAGFGSLNATRGIYLRGSADTEKVSRVLVTVSLIGYDNASLEVKNALSEMEVHLSLSCAASWVEVPRFVVFMGGTRSFRVVVDPTELPPGHAYFTEILAFVSHSDGEAIRSGPVFRFPISVHKPEPLVGGMMIRPLQNIAFTPGMVFRRFYEVPHGATFALLRVTAGESFVRSSKPMIPLTKSDWSIMKDTKTISSNGPQLHNDSSLNSHASDENFVTAKSSNLCEVANGEDREEDILPKKLIFTGGEGDTNHRALTATMSKSGHVRHFEVHIVQLRPQLHFGETDSRKHMLLHPGSVKESIVHVSSSCVLELCIAQMWSSAGQSTISKVELIFGGLVPTPCSPHVNPGALCFPRVEVACMLPSTVMSEKVAQRISGYTPRAYLTYLLRAVPAKKSTIRELGDRDVLFGIGKTFQLQLNYSFEVSESCSLKLLFPAMNRNVYESEIDGGPFVNIHDKNKRYLCSSDIYPHEISLLKGEYIALAYVRHVSMDVLENLRQMKMTVRYDLKSEISLDAYETAHAACFEISNREATRSVVSLDRGDRRALFFSTPKRSVLPKWVSPGDVIIGHMMVDKLMIGTSSSSRRGTELPNYKISMTIGPNSSTTSPSSGSSKGSGIGKDEKVKVSKANETKESEGNEEKCAEEDSKSAGKDGQCEGESDSIDPEEDRWMEASVKELRMKRLRSVLNDEKKSELFQKLYDLMRKKYPEDIEVLRSRIQWADIQACSLFTSKNSCQRLRTMVSDVVATVDEAVEKLDTGSIASHFGCNVDTDDSIAIEARETFEKKRQQLVECLFSKARCLSLVVSYSSIKQIESGKQDDVMKESKDCKNNSEHEKSTSSEIADSQKQGESGNEETTQKDEVICSRRDMDLFEKATKDLSKWVTLDGKGYIPGAQSQGLSAGSITNEDLALLGVIRETKRGRYGAALRVLDNFYGPGASKRLEPEVAISLRERILNAAGWQYLADREKLIRITRFPKHFMPF